MVSVEEAQLGDPWPGERQRGHDRQAGNVVAPAFGTLDPQLSAPDLANQGVGHPVAPSEAHRGLLRRADRPSFRPAQPLLLSLKPVSYTHLTLPTIYSV